ncbi:TaqI-like C-terminal specificity domain-containing protein [Lunatibacter salilacus]
MAKHLKPFELAAKRRTDQGDFWWELRACDYYAEFEKEKIIYPNICKRPEFTIDDSVTYTNQKCFIISKFDKSLLGILNSKLCNFLFHQILPKLRGDFFEPSYIFFKDFPILKDETGSIELLVDKIISVKKENPSADIFEWEDQIDQLVYELYGLSEEEIGIVDKSTIK